MDRGGLVTRTLLEALEEVWERGWQPADVAHAARKVTTGSSPLVVALIAEHARRTDAAKRAPAAWVDQLRELGALSHGDAAVVAAWSRTGRRSPAEAWRIVLQLAGMLRTAARIEVLVPPPSRWNAARSRPADGAADTGDDRALRRIRGLLSKAESSEFAEEAEALTAKAQELMTRYAVDAAVLSPGRPAGTDVGTRRVHVADPYVRAKMQLLATVADANDVRLVWYQGLGIANLVGGRTGLDAVELLFTSLLLQVAHGLAAADGPHTGRSASRAFRRAFLLGYAQRMGNACRSPGSGRPPTRSPSMGPVSCRSCGRGDRRSTRRSPSCSPEFARVGVAPRWTQAVGTRDGRPPIAPTSPRGAHTSPESRERDGGESCPLAVRARADAPRDHVRVGRGNAG